MFPALIDVKTLPVAPVNPKDLVSLTPVAAEEELLVVPGAPAETAAAQLDLVQKLLWDGPLQNSTRAQRDGRLVDAESRPAQAP